MMLRVKFMLGIFVSGMILILLVRFLHPKGALQDAIDDLKSEHTAALQDLSTRVDALTKQQAVLVSNSVGGAFCRGSTEKRMYGSYEGPCDLCSYSETEVMAALDQDFNCGFQGRNLFLEGSWQVPSKVQKKSDPKAPPICAIYCLENKACAKGKCLVPLFMRPGTSDFRVAEQIFGEGWLDVFNPTDNFNFILDAGGNIGISSVFFATLFPKATIITLEPSLENFKVLMRNVRRFPHVYPVHSALWSTSEKLALLSYAPNATHEEWGFKARPLSQVTSEDEVVATMQGVSTGFLLDFFDLPGFDLLKIDIEGGEANVFASEKKRWKEALDFAKLAIIETRDHMWPNANAVVLRAFSGGNKWQRMADRGEHMVFRSAL